MSRNVVILEGNSKFTFGGGQKITEMISKILAPNHRLFLVETGRSEKLYQMIAPFLQANLLLQGFSTSRSVSKASYNLRLLDYLKGLVLLPWNFLRLLCFLIKHSLFPWNSVLYASSKPGLLLGFGLQIFGYRLVSHFHTMDQKNHFLFPFFRLIARFSWKTLFASSSVQDHFSIRGQVLAPGVAVSQKSSRSIEGKSHFILATISSLTRAKGVDDAILALQEIGPELNLELWIIGEGGEESHLKKMADSRVRFWGHMDDPMEQHGDRIDLLLFPSRQPESFGLSLLEASARAIPFLTTNLGHQGLLSLEMMGVHGVASSDPKGLAKRIKDLLKNPREYQQASSKVLSEAQKYSLDGFISKVRSIFSD